MIFILFLFYKKTTMNNSELYKNYLEKLEENIISDNFENIDFILESIYTTWIPEQDIGKMDDILQEATLYSELKEEEYKEMTLKLIEEFKN